MGQQEPQDGKSTRITKLSLLGKHGNYMNEQMMTASGYHAHLLLAALSLSEPGSNARCIYKYTHTFREAQ